MDKRSFIGGEHTQPEIRQDEEGRNFIEGYGIIFGRESQNLGGFIEVIEPGAVNSSTDMSNVIGKYNHSKMIGRVTNGTLTMSVDDIGVRYRIQLPQSEDYLREMIGRGDINGSSFAFDVRKGGDQWEELDNGLMKRTIRSFSTIYDIGPVDSPAYLETSAALRSKDKHSKVSEISRIGEEQKAEREAVLRKFKLTKNKRWTD